MRRWNGAETRELPMQVRPPGNHIEGTGALNAHLPQLPGARTRSASDASGDQGRTYFLRASPCSGITTQHSRLQLHLAAQISLLCASSPLRIVLPLDDQNGGSGRGYQTSSA
jgi:hypothetical protein